MQVPANYIMRMFVRVGNRTIHLGKVRSRALKRHHRRVFVTGLQFQTGPIDPRERRKHVRRVPEDPLLAPLPIERAGH